MRTEDFHYSPNVLIYLEIGERKIRLADVLYETATLYESAEIPRGTKASLVISVDGVEERDQIVLHEGISRDSELISFCYSR